MKDCKNCKILREKISSLEEINRRLTVPENEIFEAIRKINSYCKQNKLKVENRLDGLINKLAKKEDEKTAYKIRLDGEIVELWLTKEQIDIMEKLPEEMRQKLCELIIEKIDEQVKKFEKLKDEDPEKLLGLAAQGKLEAKNPFEDIFEEFSENFKCPHCGKKFKNEK